MSKKIGLTTYCEPIETLFAEVLRTEQKQETMSVLFIVALARLEARGSSPA